MQDTEYRLTTTLNEKDTKNLKNLYRTLMKRAYQGDLTGAAQAKLLRELCGKELHMDIDAERFPCSHRRKAGSAFVCELAIAEAKRLGKKTGYYTGCQYWNMPCNDPLKTQRHQSK